MSSSGNNSYNSTQRVTVPNGDRSSPRKRLGLPDGDRPSPKRRLVVHAVDWKVEDKDTDDEHLSIYCWSLDRNSNSHLIRMETFPAFCFIQLPEYVGRRAMIWNKNKSNLVYHYLKGVLRHHAPTGANFCRRQKIYYDRNNAKYPMLLVKFKSIEAMNHCRNYLKNPVSINGIGNTKDTGKYNVWETHIPIVRKMLTERKCGYSQWFQIDAILVDPDQKVSRLDHEYIGDWRTLTPIDAIQTKGWITHPKIISFDIETYSDNHKALPVKYNSKHVAFEISCICQRLGKPETRVKKLFQLGDCGLIKDNSIVRVADEIELIQRFAQEIADYDPDLITGYNIFGYDWDYLYHRLALKNVEWPECSSRLLNKSPYYKPSNWSSSAYGSLSINQMVIPGRINVDVYLMIKRDHKLPKYNLDTVGKHFLGRGKHDVTPQDMFIAYENLKSSTEVMEKCVSEWVPRDEYVRNDENNPIKIQDYYDRITAEKGNDVLEDGNRYDSVLYPIPSYGFQPVFHSNISEPVLKDVIEEYRLARGEMTRVGAYCDEDAVLALDILEKINGWVALVEMSSIVGVSIQDIYTRGQQIRGLSQIYDFVSKLGIVIDKQEFNFGKWSGGFVWEPDPGVYDHVICLDFKSLYPSIIIAYNICFTTLVPPELENMIPDYKCNVIEWDDDGDGEGMMTDDIVEGGYGEDEDEDEDEEKKKKVKHYRFRFLKRQYRENGDPNGRLIIGKEGVLPRLVQKLIDERNTVRKEQKEEKDDVFWNVLEQRQLSMKVCANSMFGMLGVSKNGVLPLPQAAMTITALGRELITFCNDYIIEKYNAHVVYNDSVTGDTPILIRHPNGQIEWSRIDEIVNFETPEFIRGPFNIVTPLDDRIKRITNRQAKERIEPDKIAGIGAIEVWSDQGWTKIKKVIRHKTNKRIFRVITDSGMVDVTEDHSLLLPDGTEIRPKDVQVGQKLMHADLPPIPISVKDVKDIQLAVQLGGNYVTGHYENNSVEVAEEVHTAYRILGNKRMEFEKYSNGNSLINAQYSASDRIVKIIDLGRRNDYVYDLETENHHFSAGIGRMVVHNTDSTMVQLPTDVVDDGFKAIEWGYKLEEELSTYFENQGRKALYLEFEKAGRMMCIRKKKYAYWLLDLDENKKDDQNNKYPNPGFGKLKDIDNDSKAVMFKGIILARRDNCAWQRRVYKKILYKILKGSHRQEVLDIIVENMINLYLRKIKWNDLTIIRGIGAIYKSDSYFMKVFSDELRRLGIPATPGDRLEYLIVKSKDNIHHEIMGKINEIQRENKKGKRNMLLGYKMRLPEIYLDRIGTELEEEIDIEYYMEKVIMNCVEQLWQVGFRRELEGVVSNNKEEDYDNILNDLRTDGHGDYVEAYLKHTNYNKEETIKLLLDSEHKTRVITARRKYVTGRSVFDTRVGRNPIKTLFRSIGRDKLIETVKSLASPELYSRIGPELEEVVLKARSERAKIESQSPNPPQLPTPVTNRSRHPIRFNNNPILINPSTAQKIILK